MEPVPGLTANDLWLHLPNKLRARPQSRAFLSAVVDIAADFYSTYGNECSLTAAETRDQIKLLEKAAHELQQALHRFSGGDSDEFESLNTQFDYVVIRNNERPTPQAGRPLVPTLPPATPGLDELLTRINTDLSALLIATSPRIESCSLRKTSRIATKHTSARPHRNAARLPRSSKKSDGI